MKFYTKPELEISVFSTEDIITVSSNDSAVIEPEALVDNDNGALSETKSDATYSELFGN